MALINIIADIVKSDKLDPKYNADKDDITAELQAMVLLFDNWYWDQDDYRQDRLPEVGIDKPKDLIEALSKYYDTIEKEAAEDGDPFPSDAVKEAVVSRLAGAIINWPDWYYDYKVASDKEDWMERRGIENEAYIYSDYGNPDEISQIYWDEDEPYGEDDEDVDILEGGL